MDLKSAIDILSIHNDWRRDDTGELPQVQPKILGEAIDFVVSEFKNLHLQNVSVSLPSREEYDKRQLKPMYFKKDTSIGNSVLYIKGDEYEPYQWNYSRMIDLLKEGRLSYER